MHKLLFAAFLLTAIFSSPHRSWALASNNIPLDSPVYDYVEKLSGFGLIDTDIRGVRPYSRAEVARLLAEARANEGRLFPEEAPLAEEIMRRLKELIPRETSLYAEPGTAPVVDFNPVSYARLRYVHLDGHPRSFNRDIFIPGDQSVFGFIGGNLRPGTAGLGHESGTEGTPLLENNEGVMYRTGNNGEMRFAVEAYLLDKASLLVEPSFLASRENTALNLEKGYLKIGGRGIELEVGRDANWFGPGRRGALTLSNNARNFDLVKLSSPEPVDVGWVKHYLGEFKYAFILSRFDETGSDDTLRRPYFVGIKLALKPKPWWEVGVNFVRQEGGPGFSGSSTLQDTIFGGGTTNHNNTIAGIDLRFRIPWLANTELYGEYAGEDSAGFWPFVESYIAGFYIPRLTSSGRDDFRFEFFYGNPMLYTDFKFPEGYVYKGMTVGDSQGGGVLEFYGRYSHWLSPRNIFALEYFRTDRGHEGRVTVNADNRFDPNGGLQALERKHAVRATWNLPLYGDVDLAMMYGWERISNFNLIEGEKLTNQVFRADVTYRY